MRFGHGTRDELRLAAITMGGHDEPPRDKVGCGRAVIAADEMEREVEPGSRPGGCQNVALVDIKDIRQDFDLREARGKSVGIAPVRVARLLSRRPAAASTKTPEQIDSIHARAAFMRRYQSLA